MPVVPLPRELDELVAQPSAAVVATVRPDGSPHTAATGYDWEGGRVLLNMDESRARLRHMRENPHVSITIFVEGDVADQVTLFGRIESIEPDGGLKASIAWPFSTRGSHSVRATADG